MDFPLKLSKLVPITGIAEFKQCVYLLLKVQIGNFLQNYSMGSLVEIHSSEADLLEENIRNTLSQIKECEIEDVTIFPNEDTQLVLKYQGKSVDFKFNLKEIYGNEK